MLALVNYVGLEVAFYLINTLFNLNYDLSVAVAWSISVSAAATMAYSFKLGEKSKDSEQ